MMMGHVPSLLSCSSVMFFVMYFRIYYMAYSPRERTVSCVSLVRDTHKDLYWVNKVINV